MATDQLRVNVLTLNCWGLLLVSKQRAERMQHLATYLSQATFLDIVLLQEVWVGADADLLISSARNAGLLHAIHFRSGVFGSGLVTLSRWPILEAGFHLYSAAGDALAVHCGDYLAAKGYGWARISSPAGPVDVFNTHTHANYSHEASDHYMPPRQTKSDKNKDATVSESQQNDRTSEQEAKGSIGAAGRAAASRAAAASGTTPPSGTAASGYLLFKVPQDRFAPYRLCQMWELARGVRQVSKMGSIGTILAGDLNSKPDSLEIALLGAMVPGLTDSWAQLHPEDEGFTCRGPGCTFKSTRQIPERIDYVLTTLNPTSCTVTLTTSPGGMSYSDHFAVLAELALCEAVPGGSGALRLTSAERSEAMSVTRGILEAGARRSAVKRGQAYKAAALALLVSLTGMLTLVSDGALPTRMLQRLLSTCLAALVPFLPEALRQAVSTSWDAFESYLPKSLTLVLSGHAAPATSSAAAGAFSSSYASMASRRLPCSQVDSSSGLSSSSLAAMFLEGLRTLLLVLGAMGFSFLAAVLLLSGFMADSAQERALGLLARQVQLLQASEAW